MERTAYLLSRERELLPHLAPDAPKFTAEQRATHVDCLYKMSYYMRATDATPFAAARMLDRCMALALPSTLFSETQLYLSFATATCFEIAYKLTDSDSGGVPRGMLVDYVMAVNPWLPKEHVRHMLKIAGLDSMVAMEWQPYVPTPFDYIADVCPSMLGMPIVRQMCAASTYSHKFAALTSIEIAAAAIDLAMQSGSPPLPQAGVSIVSMIPRDKLSYIQSETLDIRSKMMRSDICGYKRYFYPPPSPTTA